MSGAADGGASSSGAASCELAYLQWEVPSHKCSIQDDEAQAIRHRLRVRLGVISPKQLPGKESMLLVSGKQEIYIGRPT